MLFVPAKYKQILRISALAQQRDQCRARSDDSKQHELLMMMPDAQHLLHCNDINSGCWPAQTTAGKDCPAELVCTTCYSNATMQLHSAVEVLVEPAAVRMRLLSLAQSGRCIHT